ncbi:CAP domain-containing protein [Streptomyces sp. NPDC127097]|uniref:CAP domain-containing protein n=1 Tax=Streptomyces sp. NPDC127097 TaxID=3347136 RepID=UPI003663DE84
MKFSSVKRAARGAHRRRVRMIPLGVLAAAGVLGGSLAVFNSQDNATANEAFPQASGSATPDATGYDDASAENIDAWPTTPQGAFDAWMHSSGHRANILGCHSKGTGIGVALGGKHRAYWTQDFGYR